VAQESMRRKLVELVEDTHAMERATLGILDSLISQTEDVPTRSALERHKRQTEEHEQRLAKRLQALGSRPSAVMEAAGALGPMARGVMDKARSDRPLKVARDVYATEHMEIAAYHMMERLAERAGDNETAEIARRNRLDEELMARLIAQSWDKFAELDLVQEGVLSR
jgi:ferritin-like metal-binding protein YciE